MKIYGSDGASLTSMSAPEIRQIEARVKAQCAEGEKLVKKGREALSMMDERLRSSSQWI